MKTKYLVIYIILGLSIIVSVVMAADIQYPVEKLGNCENEADCRSYCDKPDNINVCLDFAQENNLMSDQEIAKARKFLEAGAKGPGGCEGKEECETYCNNIDHIDECISFAEEHDLIPPEELEEAKKVQAAIKRGVKPPPCGNKQQCDVYCEEPEHMEECITFGIEAGFIQGKELEDVQKMLQAVKRGVKPPPCKGKEACDEYCSSPDNMEVCINFAIEAGFMSEEEKADSQKMLGAMKKGIKPPPCKGREECDVYCGQEEHLEECMNFAVAAGFMSEKDAEMARKTGGKGPGDCKGKEECEAFCNNPDNQETCFNFAKEHGLIPEEDLQRMEQGKQQFQQSLQQAPQEVIDCLQEKLGADMVEKMKNGVMPGREIGDQMQECFQKMGPPQGQEGQGMPQSGPGGCKGPEECKAYCESNPEECKGFGPGPGEINPGGQQMSEQSGPGGCKGPEECRVFCESNPEQCQNFQQGSSFQGQPCEGENCQRPPEGQMPPCEGENCQFGPPPQGQIPPPEEELRPPEGSEQQNYEQQYQQQYEQQYQQQIQQMIPQDQQQLPQEIQPQQPPSETQPPPPPPPVSILKPDSLVASVLYIIAKALYSLR